MDSIVTISFIVISAVAFVLSIFAIVSAKKTNANFQRSLEIISGLHKDSLQYKTELKHITQSFENTKSELSSLESLFAQYEKNNEQRIETVKQQLRDQVLQDPIVKRYSKANELLKSGASAEEVMETCDIPMAEVEILLGILRRN